MSNLDRQILPRSNCRLAGWWSCQELLTSDRQHQHDQVKQSALAQSHMMASSRWEPSGAGTGLPAHGPQIICLTSRRVGKYCASCDATSPRLANTSSAISISFGLLDWMQLNMKGSSSFHPVGSANSEQARSDTVSQTCGPQQ